MNIRSNSKKVRLKQFRLNGLVSERQHYLSNQNKSSWRYDHFDLLIKGNLQFNNHQQTQINQTLIQSPKKNNDFLVTLISAIIIIVLLSFGIWIGIYMGCDSSINEQQNLLDEIVDSLKNKEYNQQISIKKIKRVQDILMLALSPLERQIILQVKQNTIYKRKYTK